MPVLDIFIFLLCAFFYNKNYEYVVLDMFKILKILSKITKFINCEIEINDILNESLRKLGESL